MISLGKQQFTYTYRSLVTQTFGFRSVGCIIAVTARRFEGTLPVHRGGTKMEEKLFRSNFYVGTYLPHNGSSGFVSNSKCDEVCISNLNFRIHDLSNSTGGAK